jgi:transcriptional regulator GlxA family with amidase domain
MKRNVAILLFNEVEVLDFAGPFEVFAVTDELAEYKLFNVYTIADTPGTVRTRNGLLVIPEHTFESAPAPDVIIVPGGVGTRALLKKPSVLDWLRRRSRSTQVTASVCTGALVLAQAGLLDGLDATTHYENLDDLARLAPTARVSGDRRFHDHGSVATAAGISAGIDLSLHLVARLTNEETARKTARYMEYHWRNDNGSAR